MTLEKINLLKKKRFFMLLQQKKSIRIRTKIYILVEKNYDYHSNHTSVHYCQKTNITNTLTQTLTLTVPELDYIGVFGFRTVRLKKLKKRYIRIYKK